jgi:hypothetical protein
MKGEFRDYLENAAEAELERPSVDFEGRRTDYFLGSPFTV